MSKKVENSTEVPSSEKKKPKYGKIIEGASELSLGISIVVAIVLGVVLGLWLKSLTGYMWTLWLGVIFGIGAAVKNVHIAYKKQKKIYDELKNEPRYKYQADEDDDDKY